MRKIKPEITVSNEFENRDARAGLVFLLEKSDRQTLLQGTM